MGKKYEQKLLNFLNNKFNFKVSSVIPMKRPLSGDKENKDNDKAGKTSRPTKSRRPNAPAFI